MPSLPERWRPIVAGWALPCVLGAAAAFVHLGTLLSVGRSQDDEISTIAEVRGHILDRWVEDPPREKMRYGAVDGMVSALDRFSRFFPPDEKEKFDEDTEGLFGGLGVFIEIDREKKELVVTAPMEDTPAWRAKLLPGDRIVEVDGRARSFATVDEAQKVLKGKPGTRVRLGIAHEGRPRREVELERARVKQKSVHYASIVDAANGVGYAAVTAFQDPTLADFERAVADLRVLGMRALVVDLRANVGGLLRTALDMASRFVPKGEVVLRTRGRKDEEDALTRADGPQTLDESVPVALLIDEGSASASEVLGGALRDHDRAVLVGARSYGKGSVQHVIAVEGGRSTLKLTTQHYFTPKRRRIDKPNGAKKEDEWGLVPDIAVDLDAKSFAQIRHALDQRELAALQEKALRELGGDTPPPASQPASRPPVPRDLPLEAAVAHLAAVLQGHARLVPAAPAGVASVGSPTGTGTPGGG